MTSSERAAIVRPDTRVAVVGGYTESEADPGRVGVELWTRDARDRAWRRVAETVASQPSWLVDLGDGRLLAVGEGDPSTLGLVRVASDGGAPSLELDDVLALSGVAACHAAVAGRFAVVAHYGSGSVSSVRLDPAGRPTEEVDHLAFSGSGPDAERQEAPHAHQVVVDGEEVLVADLGSDRVHRLGLDGDGRLRTRHDPIELPAGFGPRHVVRTGELLVVAGELSNELWLGRVAGPDVEPLDVAPLDPPGADGAAYPSALRVDADGLLWTGVRGPDTVAVHRIAGDRLVAVASAPTGGRWPRDVVVDGEEVWVTNQLSHDVTVLDRAAVLAGAGAAVRTQLASAAPTAVVLVGRGARPSTSSAG